MAKITCPNCGEIIEIDPSSVEDLTRQLRDELFAHDLEERLAEAGHLHHAQVEAARTEERREADRRVAEVQAQKAKVQAQLDAAQGERDLAVQKERGAAAEQLSQLKAALSAEQQQAELALERAKAQATEQIAQLQAKLDAAAREGELAAERVRTQAAEERSALQRKLDEAQLQAHEQLAQATETARKREVQLQEEAAQLKARLVTQEETLRAQSEAELLKVTSQLEQRRSELEARLVMERASSEQAQAALREKMALRESELAQHSEEQLEAKDAQIEQYKAEVERLRDYRMRLSTKLIGESLERHCETEFNRIRMQAYPHATFERDTIAVEGTKGDFIFRDYDEEGHELLSIMFEMKNEEEMSATTNRKRNEDHFKKLDSDRTKKQCEYAVLVSTLEPDNDFYNAGIADVSWRYPKMFVVRPQCFTTIIGLLKAAALTAHPYRMQLERAKREELDVSTFESKVATIVDSIENDYTRAAKNYERAEADIDAIIKKLEDLKKQLKTATTWFSAAQKQGEKLTVKRLTWGNPTMKEAFAEWHAQEEQAVEQELSASDDEALDPDELE